MRRMYSENQIKKVVEQGDLNVNGSITGDEIVENMSGYAFEITFDEDYGDLALDYAGVCKNGNKITFALAGKITFNSSGISAGGLALGSFTIPATIGEKLYPTSIGNLTNLLSLSGVYMYGANNTINAGKGRLLKNADTAVGVLIYSAGCTADIQYSFRFESTFLLSENLAPQEP